MVCGILLQCKNVGYRINMSSEFIILVSLACVLGITHTLIGPDHYLPFIMMARARKWSLQKTLSITAVCGFGHVLSSVLLGFIGIVFGVALRRLEWIESWRGDLASWVLISFGLLYFIWGVHRLSKHKPHTHKHVHSDGSTHSHEHVHAMEHTHVHEQSTVTKLIPWSLFVIFILGPCEVLIPLLMYPSAIGEMWQVLMVAVVFSLATMGTMLLTVSGGYLGLQHVSFKFNEGYLHPIAGFVICSSGLAIKFLGL